MLIPCIDVMSGKIVQLIGGERTALEFDDPEPWIRKFAGYPLVHVVDLDAAMRRGSNRDFIAQFAKRLHCQVGGGIRNADDASELLDLGAKRVVVGSALISQTPSSARINTAFASALSDAIGPDRLVFSVDTKRGML